MTWSGSAIALTITWVIIAIIIIIGLIQIYSLYFDAKYAINNQELYVCGDMGNIDYSNLRPQLLNFDLENTNLDTFDVNLGKFLAQMNMINYAWICGHPNAQELPLIPIIGKTKFGNDKLPYASYWPKYNLLVFRGTLNNPEWLADANIRQEPSITDKNYLVHQGFNKLYATMKDQLRHIIDYDRPLIITGHSLGGATSTLAAYDLAHVHQEVILYSFASPRVGTPEFVEDFARWVKTSYRIQNQADIVTQMPVSILNLRYKHIYPVMQFNTVFAEVNSSNFGNNHSLCKAYFDGMSKGTIMDNPDTYVNPSNKYAICSGIRQ